MDVILYKEFSTALSWYEISYLDSNFMYTYMREIISNYMAQS